MMSARKILVKKNQHTFDHGEEDKKKVVIDSLDYDVLAEIIMRLPIADRIDIEEVCVKWNEACKLAWYDVKKYKCESTIGRSYDNRLLTQSYLKKILLRCGKYLKELSLSNHATDSIMPFIGNHCRNLTNLECELQLSNWTYSTDEFVRVLTQLDKLKYIRISIFHNEGSRTFDLFRITDGLPEEINEIHLISGYWMLLNVDISISFKKFRNLQKLTLDSYRNLDNMTLHEIAEKTTLVYLKIQIYKIPEKSFLFDKLVNLEYIDLTQDFISRLPCPDGYTCSIDLLHTIVCTCKNLKHLDLPRTVQLPFFDISTIPSEKWIYLKNLEYLGCSGDIMPELANTIVENCRNLKHLKVYNSYHSSTNHTALKKLTELKNLESLVWIPRIDLNEELIIAISNNCKKLKRFEIPKSTIELSITIDDEPLTCHSVFNEFSKLQYLEHLNLRNVRNLSDSTIIAIVNNCKNLKYLDIQNCKSLTETALIALTNLENLQKLYVAGLVITDRVLTQLQGLKEFHCSLNPKVTSAAISAFIRTNSDLEKLYLEGSHSENMVFVAGWAIKNRTNGIILNITIHASPILASAKIQFQWLKVSYLHEPFYQCIGENRSRVFMYES